MHLSLYRRSMNTGFPARENYRRGRRSEITGEPEDRSRRPSPSGAEKPASKRGRALSGVIFPMTCAPVCQSCAHRTQKSCPFPRTMRQRLSRTWKSARIAIVFASHSFKRFVLFKVFSLQVLDTRPIAPDHARHYCARSRCLAGPNTMVVAVFPGLPFAG